MRYLLILAIFCLTACSSPDQPATPSSSANTPSASPDASADVPTDVPLIGRQARFRATGIELSKLVSRIGEEASDVEPTNAGEANRAARLTASSALSFADYEVRGNGGRFCLESRANRTYVAFQYGDELVLTLGDNACTYDVGEAEVVGDLTTNTWTRGARLMDDVQVITILGANP